MRLRMQTSSHAREFIGRIVDQMVDRFGISRDEAVARVNDAWGHLDHIGDDDLIFHETAEYWARTIYYGKDSHWWLGGEGPSAGSVPE